MDIAGVVRFAASIYLWFVLPVIVGGIAWVILRITFGPVVGGPGWIAVISSLAFIVAFVFRLYTDSNW